MFPVYCFMHITFCFLCSCLYQYFSRVFLAQGNDCPSYKVCYGIACGAAVEADNACARGQTHIHKAAAHTSPYVQPCHPRPLPLPQGRQGIYVIHWRLFLSVDLKQIGKRTEFFLGFRWEFLSKIGRLSVPSAAAALQAKLSCRYYFMRQWAVMLKQIRKNIFNLPLHFRYLY